MTFQRYRAALIAITLALVMTLGGMKGEAQAAGSVTLSVDGGAYQQDFDTLASTGTSNTAVPTGWDFLETGTNANTTYSAGTGSSNTGDTYSFGAASSTERAFGCLRSGSLVPRVGVQFTNSTGGVITTLAISYVGERWRLGATGRADRLDFQLSTSATSLTDGPAGTWVDYDSLDFSSPVTAGTVGAQNGNDAANRTTVSYAITGLSIANGAAFWIRWSDYDATGADDGLAVDDFSLTVVNNAPTDIALSPNTVAEDSAANTVVGAFSTTDPDTGNTFTYTLATGAGSADNASFNVTAGGNLRTSASFDYEAKNSYAIRVRSTDQGNLWFEKQFTITVSDVGEAPTDIALSNASVPENAGADAVVGTLSGTDPDLGQSATLTFSLPAGLSDNALFNISGATLRAADSLDYEVAASHTVTVRATDAVGLTYDETFTLTVTDVFDPPTGSIALTALGATHAEGFNSLASSGSSGTVPSGWYFVEAGTSAYVNTAYRAGIGSSNIGDTYSFGDSTDRAFGCLFSNTLTPLLGAQFTNNTGVTIQALTVSYTGEQWRLGETGRADRLDFQLSTSATSLADGPAGTWVDYDSLDFSSPLTAGAVGAQNGNDAANRTAVSSTITGLSIANGVAFWIRWADYDVPGSDDGLAVDDFSLTPYAAPTDIALSNASVPENAGADAVVGTLSGTDPDLGQSATLTFSLPAGLSDNALFNISGATLRAADSLDYEVAASHTVTVRATDAVGLTYDETFTLTVSDVNEAPSITSDGGGATAAVSVAENSMAATTVTATDSDAGTTLTYSIAGGADQATFDVNGSSGALTFVSAPDFETPTDIGADNVYEVTVEVSDGSLIDTQAISVTLTDANEAPTDIALSNASVPENAGADAVVGTLSGTDPDLGQSATLTFSLPAGLSDNALFNISGATLRAADSLDYEVAASHTVTVRATDAVGLTYDETFTLTVTDVAAVYTLTYIAGRGGSIAGASLQTVEPGQDGTKVTAVPDPGYHFYQWTDGVTKASRIDTNVMADKSVKALFAPDVITHPHTLTYTAGMGGSIAGAGLQIVEHGRDGTEVTAVPDPGYRFLAWSDGVPTASRTDTDVRADLTVMAEFALAPDRWTDISNQQWVDVYGVTADEVDAVADGYSDGTFRPSLPVNRAQFSKMVVDGFGLPKLSPIVPSFSDVPVAHFFYEWTEGAFGAGIVTGYPDGTFRPDQSISRQQANSILGRYLSHKELADTGVIEGDLGSYASVAEWYVAEGAAVLAPFADVSQLATVHAPFTAYLVYHNVVLGSSSAGSTYLTPLSELTRAQAAAMVVRIK